MTPKQIEILNLRIAEHAGYTGNMRPNYAHDLNAIVPVVQRYLDDKDCDLEPYHSLAKFKILIYKNPALALCIAFAKAAGLEWEK